MTTNEFELTNLVSGAMTLSETMCNTKLYWVILPKIDIKSTFGVTWL